MKERELDQFVGGVSAAFDAGMRGAFDAWSDRLDRTINAVRVHGAEYRTIVGDASTIVSGSRCRWLGFMLTEPTGLTGATLELYDGTTGDGPLIGTVELNAGESTRDYLGPGGVACTYGLYVKIVSGSIAGSVFITAAP